MAAAAGASLAAPQAAVADAVASDATTQFTVGAGPVWYRAEEPSPNGRVASRDTGRLARVSLGVRHDIGDWRLGGSLSQVSGAANYRGQNQFGLPLFTTTDLRRRDFAVTLERVWRIGERNTLLSAGGGLGTLRSERNIRATPISSRLTETLAARQWMLTAGASTTQTLMSLPLNLFASAQVSRPWWQKLDVDAHGAIDPLRLRPRAAWGGRLEVGAGLSLTPSWRVGLTAGWDVYRPGAADSRTVYRNGLPAGSASYPGSHQRIGDVSLFLAWAL